MKFIMSLMMMMSGLIFVYKHPLMLNAIIIIQTILTAMISNLIYFSSWLSLVLFMVMIGGMMVMFIYMTSMSSNKKMKLKKKLFISWIITSFIFYPLINQNSEKTSMLTQPSYLDNWKMEISMNKFINFPSSMLMISLMIYMFITMMTVNKITYKKYGPIRQK